MKKYIAPHIEKIDISEDICSTYNIVFVCSTWEPDTGDSRQAPASGSYIF